MKVLVIIADCIRTNSSANLCHISYLKGLSDLGHDVTLLTCDEKDYIVDDSIAFPSRIKVHRVGSISFYQKLSLKKQEKNNTSLERKNSVESNNTNNANGLLNIIKKQVLSLYGVYGITSPFIRQSRKYKSNDLYDYVISVSYPQTSHMAAYRLIKSGRVKAKHWIQIWEDPWCGDVYSSDYSQKKFYEEKRLLSLADEIYYVSPLTLKYCKEQFAESANKMRWQPLPYYYKDYEPEGQSFSNNCYGYFGDYVPISRNLEPFFTAAEKLKIKVNICGKPDGLFKSSESITIYPRLPLDKLKPIEEKTNVLVFLCNRKGGQIPGKIYQYSATYKTILFILDGTDEEKEDLKSFFQKFNRYVFCENTVEDISRAIIDIENNNIGNVENKPVEDFSPARIVDNILKGKDGF